MREIALQQIEECIEHHRKLNEHHVDIFVQIAECFLAAVEKGGTIYFCGNGGSAADAQHVVAELVGRLMRERRAIPAIALTTDTSILTAVSNDYGYERVFARQVEAFVTEKDILVAISTSGKSGNVRKAVEIARKRGACVIGFTGEPGEPLASESSLCFCAPAKNTQRIQEIHILAWHIICDLVERAIAK